MLQIAGLKAQGTEGYGSGMRVNLDSSGQKYLRIINWHQVWLRQMDNNPGTLVNGTPTSSQLDVSLRRSRLLVMMQLNPKFMIMTHFGINNQTDLTGGVSGVDGKKPQMFIHDAVAEYKVYKNYLSLGAGLHYVNGVSRKANTSTLNFLTLDAPIHNWANIDATDQFGRNLGIYVKGKLGKLDYRLAMNQPFAIPVSTGSALSKLDTFAASKGVTNATYNGMGHPKQALQGYFMYQFWDQESNALPYTVGTYVGTKRVFNLGAGFTNQKDAMWAPSKNSVTGKYDTLKFTQNIWAVDAFLDMPLSKKRGDAITAYLEYLSLDMGKNYVRNIGVDNPANGVLNVANGGTFSGGGNAFATVGTGKIIYAELGYLLPKFGKIGRFQLYGDYTHAKYDRVTNAVGTYDLGINYLVAGHAAKITFNYRNRPLLNYVDVNQTYGELKGIGSKNEFVLQFVVCL